MPSFVRSQLYTAKGIACLEFARPFRLGELSSTSVPPWRAFVQCLALSQRHCLTELEAERETRRKIGIRRNWLGSSNCISELGFSMLGSFRDQTSGVFIDGGGALRSTPPQHSGSLLCRTLALLFNLRAALHCQGYFRFGLLDCLVAAS